MTIRDQLEIIRPDGTVSFYTLDQVRGVTNIGRHPDNDIKLYDAQTDPLYAVVLDHRQGLPYSVLVVDDDVDIRINGQSLTPNTPHPFHPWDTMEIGAYLFVLSEPAPPPIQPAQRLAAPPTSEPNPIEIMIPEREQTTHVDYTATYSVQITNAGDREAAFNVQVADIDPAWVKVSYPNGASALHLHNNQQGIVFIQITPPKAPTSRAGQHTPVVTVTSPQYAQRQAREAVTLNIEPYYSANVSTLHPKEQTVRGATPLGEATLTLTNRSNTPVAFTIEGEDNEGACSFEFDVPESSVDAVAPTGATAGANAADGQQTQWAAKRAEVPLASGQTLTVPIRMIPHTSPVIGWRTRIHYYTITAAMQQENQTPHQRQGQLRVRPRFHTLAVIGVLLLLLAAFILGFYPWIYTFEAIPSKGTIALGQKVPLQWTVSWSARRLTLEKNGRPWKEDFDPEEYAEVPLIVAPQRTMTYTLVADNFLTRLPLLKPARRPVVIDVERLETSIQAFGEMADRHSITTGHSVTLTWRVHTPYRVMLGSVGPDEEFRMLEEVSYAQGPRGEVVGTIQQTPDASIRYRLCAENNFGDATYSEPWRVTVLPYIRYFDVNEDRIFADASVNIKWDVEDAGTVRIEWDDGQRETKDNQGNITVTLAQPGVKTFRLKAYPSGETEYQESHPVRVTVDPPPANPAIAYFGVSSHEIVRGGGGNIELHWSVGGATDIEITNLTASGMPEVYATTLTTPTHTGHIPVAAPDVTTQYQLTVRNLNKPEAAPAIKTTEVMVRDPDPVIEYFTYANPSPESKKRPDGSIAVPMGAAVTVRWSVKNAASVELYRSTNAGEEIPMGIAQPDGLVIQGNYDEPSVTQPTTLRLEARGSQDKPSRNLKFVPITTTEVISGALLPTPHNVRTTSNPDDPALTLVWDFDPGDHAYAFRGFWIYRTRIDPEKGKVAVAEMDRQWFDYEPTCARVYRVTARYARQVDGTIMEIETKPAQYTSWPCPPTLQAVNALSNQEIEVVWRHDDPQTATHFEVERSEDDGNTWKLVRRTGKTDTFIHDKVQCSTRYHYRVRAYRVTDDQHSLYSDVHTLRTADCPIAPPANLRATPFSQNEIGLTWVDQSDSESTFVIEHTTDRTLGTWPEAGRVPANEVRYTDSGLDCGTTYYYQVRAERETDGARAYSDVVSATTHACPITQPPAPTLTVTPAPEAVKITWAYNDAETLEIERWIEGEAAWTPLVTLPTTVPVYIDQSLVCTTTHYYRARACRATGEAVCSAYSEPASTTPQCVQVEAPPNLKVAEVGASYATLTWGYNADPTSKFFVERSPDGEDWAFIDSVAGDVFNYTDIKLICDRAYYYRVRVFRQEDRQYSDPSNVVTVTLPCPPTPPPAPPILSGTALSQTAIRLQWTYDRADQISDLYIERWAQETLTWTMVNTRGIPIDWPHYDDNGGKSPLTCDTTYTYRAATYRESSGQLSIYSPVIEVATQPCHPQPPAPTLAVAPALESTRVTWTYDHADTIRLDRWSEGGTAWTPLADLAATDAVYLDEGLSCTTTYYYRARACRATAEGEVCSTYSAPASAIPYCQQLKAPRSLEIEVTSATQVTMTWRRGDEQATGFTVERSTDGKDWLTVNRIKATDDPQRFTDAIPECDVLYHYRVRAYREWDALSSSASNVVSVKPRCQELVPPQDLNVSEVNVASITLVWGYNADPTLQLFIERSPDGTQWASIGSVAGDVFNYTDRKLICDHAYRYRVRAFRLDDKQYSTPSNEVITSTLACPSTPLPAPPILSGSPLSETATRLQWTYDHADQISDIYIERWAQETLTWTTVSTRAIPIGWPHYDDDGDESPLTCGTVYAYRAVTYRESSGQRSPYSPVIEVTTQPCRPLPPTNLDATATSPTEVALRWTYPQADVATISHFRVERWVEGTVQPVTLMTTYSTAYTDQDLACETAYHYRVRAYSPSLGRYSHPVEAIVTTRGCR